MLQKREGLSKESFLDFKYLNPLAPSFNGRTLGKIWSKEIFIFKDFPQCIILMYLESS